MSAMKMEFICKDAPDVPPPHDSPTASSNGETDADRPAMTMTTQQANAKAKLSALLNTTTASPRNENDGDSDVEMSEMELPQDQSTGDLERTMDPDSVDSVVRDQMQARDTTMGGFKENGIAGIPPPTKKAKIAFVEPQEAMSGSVTEPSAGHTDADTNAVSDNENSEDEQVEYAPWEEIELNPAVELVNKLVRESLEAGKTYNKSITAKTSQLVAGCDNVLLELKNLSDAREVSRKQSSKQQAQQEGDCACGVAMAMLPLSVQTEAITAAQTNATESKRVGNVDEITEDQTCRALLKIEASMERLRELAELIQATSMQGEANLVTKVTLDENALRDLHTAVQASAAAATAAAIAQERGRSMSMPFSGRLYSPLQVKKLQEWYYSYPRPLTDELTLMRTILNYRPYSNPFNPAGLTIAQIREWFKRRRYRERIRYVKLAVEAGRDAVAAEEEIDLRIEQRIENLRSVVDPNELVKDLDKVRAESSLYDASIMSFARNDMLDTYLSMSHGIPSISDHFSANGGRAKRQRTQDADLDDAFVVKVGTPAEISALQKRIRTLLATPRSATNTNGLQQVIDVLRSMDVSKEVRVQTGVVADLKKILKTYRKPTLLRKSTIALLESLGMTRRMILDHTARDEEPPKPSTLAAPGLVAVPVPVPEAALVSAPASASKVEELVPEPVAFAVTPEDAVVSPDAKLRKKKVQRPMKFSMRQVRALEEWFQERYKPTQSEMEGYLVSLNSSPLREPKQSSDVNMTQLRRWFNKRRCLGRPPFALMTQQEEENAGMTDNGSDSKFMEEGSTGGVDPTDLTVVEAGENSDSSDEDDSSDDE